MESWLVANTKRLHETHWGEGRDGGEGWVLMTVTGNRPAEGSFAKIETEWTERGRQKGALRWVPRAAEALKEQQWRGEADIGAWRMITQGEGL